MKCSWLMSGLPVIKDQNITRKILKIFERHRTLVKSKPKQTKCEDQKREAFKEEMSSLFDISAADVVAQINKDRLRSEEAKTEDLSFLDDQKGARKMSIGNRDKDYDDSVASKFVRDSRLARVEMVAGGSQGSTDEHGGEGGHVSEDDSDGGRGDCDFIPINTENKAPKRSAVINLSIPTKELAKLTSVTAKRYKLGTRAQSDILTNVLVAGGASLDAVPCSRSSVRRAGIEAVKETTENIKKNFKENIDGTKLMIYIDGKSIPEFSDGMKTSKKRVAVIAKSHKMENEQVLAVPETKSNSGLHQSQAVTPVLEDWEVKNNILGFGFDTTADNTGKHKGLIIRLEKWIGSACWWSACPHHHYELHVKKLARLIYGESTSPDEQLYKKFQGYWNKLIENGINYENLELFSWEEVQGTFLEEQVWEVLIFCKACLEANVFPREDYKELCSLVVVWLAGPEAVDGFSFQYPGAFHHARFMMQAIYSLKIRLLSNQVDILSREEKDQIKVMAEFVGLFHSFWFLKCPVASSSPFLQLQSIMQMKRYGEHRPDISDLVLGSMKNHLWHITEQSVITALVDEDLPTAERKSLALALFNTPRPDSFLPEQPQFPDIFKEEFHPQRLWLSGQLPPLHKFVGPKSWLLFYKLQLGQVDCEWLQLDPAVWPLISGFQSFKSFVSKTTIVNDPAERGVALAADFRGSFQDENIYQSNLVAVAESRKLVPRDAKKSVKAEALKRLCGL